MTHVSLASLLADHAADFAERCAIEIDGAPCVPRPWETREKSNPPPSELAPNAPLWASPFVPSPARLTRRVLYRLRDELRKEWPKRVNKRGVTVDHESARCGYTRCSRDVELVVTTGPDGRRSAFVRGVVTCSNVWACAVCSSAIRSERASEVRAAVEWHGSAGTFLLSLTVRHAWGDDPTVLTKGVASAWSAFTNGMPWRRFREHVGMVGAIRGLETTHGKHGWHPHIHALVFVKHPERLAEKLEWLRSRWADVVARQLGEEHRTNDHGLDLKQASCAEYISKLGLEITAPASKVGKKGRSPWEIASAWVVERDPRDLSLFLAYVEAFRGARALVWSNGLKRAAGITERTDEEIASERDARREEQIAVLPGAVWCAMRRRRGAIEALLCLAEDEPAQVAGYVEWHSPARDDADRPRGPPNSRLSDRSTGG